METPNPPAFPTMEHGYDKTGLPNVTTEAGMTLRDYFAAKENGKNLAEGFSLESAKKIMGTDPPGDTVNNTLWWMGFEAKLQYMKADAMLKQRNL